MIVFFILLFSSSVLLNLVSGTIAEEKEWPLSKMFVSETGCEAVDSCHQAHWLAQFSAQDLGSGMFSLRIRSFQERNKLYWWFDQFKVWIMQNVFHLTDSGYNCLIETQIITIDVNRPWPATGSNFCIKL